LIDSARADRTAPIQLGLIRILARHESTRLAVAAQKRVNKNTVGSTSASATFVMLNVDPHINAVMRSPRLAASLVFIRSSFAIKRADSFSEERVKIGGIRTLSSKGF